MTSITSVAIEVPHRAAAEAFYAAAFGLDSQLELRASDAPTSGFRGFTRGLSVARSFARAYAEFDTTGIKLGLYKRRALAKDAGVPPQGDGSHRMMVVSDAGPFTDPDGFAWEATRRDEDPPFPQTDKESRSPDPSRA